MTMTIHFSHYLHIIYAFPNSPTNNINRIEAPTTHEQKNKMEIHNKALHWYEVGKKIVGGSDDWRPKARRKSF